MKVILTGATGMVGEGVLLECLAHPDVEKILLLTRKPYGVGHVKLTERIVPDFFHLDDVTDAMAGYDACFYCAGVSSRGMKEPDYNRLTYELTLHFAQVLERVNPEMSFNYLSGTLTDSSEKGGVMWARVKGKTENALVRVGFRRVYHFRPGFIEPSEGQKNVKSYYKAIGWLYPVLRAVVPNYVNTMHELGLAMINSVRKGYSKQTLEIRDIRVLAEG